MTLDDQVNALFEALEKKKAQVLNTKNNIDRKWITNCQYPLNGTSVNLTTASLFVVETIAIDLAKSLVAHAKAEEILEKGISLQIGGYSFDDWQKDIRKRLAVISIANQEKDLASLEARINSVMSPEARRAKEIELLQKELN